MADRGTSSARRKLGVALIGQGFMGKAHSNAYRQAGHFFDLPFDLDLCCLCGRNAANLDAMAARWGWRETTTDWAAAIEMPGVDIVDVAVPNHLHAEIVTAAAQAGKIVFCEKPLAVSAAEAERMAAAARHRPSLVWFNYRRAPGVQLARRLVEEGRVGRPFHYRGWYLQEWGNDPTRPPGWKTSKAEAGSGVLGDLLSHAVDLAMHLNGPIAEVTAMQHTFAAGRDVDDATLALVRFANGSLGSLEATRYGTGFRNRNAFELHGDKGAVRFSLEDMNRLEYFDGAAQPREFTGFANLLASNQFWKPGHISGYEHTFIATLAEFLIAFAEGGAFHPNLDDAAEVQRVLETIEIASSSRSWTPVVRTPSREP